MSKEIKKLSAVISAEEVKMLKAAAHYEFCGIQISDMDAEDLRMIVGLLLLKIGEMDYAKEQRDLKNKKTKLILPDRFSHA